MINFKKLLLEEKDMKVGEIVKHKKSQKTYKILELRTRDGIEYAVTMRIKEGQTYGAARVIKTQLLQKIEKNFRSDF